MFTVTNDVAGVAMHWVLANPSALSESDDCRTGG